MTNRGSRFEVRDVDEQTFKSVAHLLRQEDKDEWRLFAGIDLDDPDLKGFTLPPAGDDTFTRGCWLDDQLMCVWGVSPAPMLYGSPGWVWLVATPEAVPKARSLMTYVMREQLAEMLVMHPFLYTACWAGNHEHVKWLNRVGFDAIERPWVVPSGGIFIPHTYRG